jgi:hypothetical protein
MGGKEMIEVIETFMSFISLEEQVWLAGMWAMVMIFPYMFIKTGERAVAYCEQRHTRLTTRGIRAIALLYLGIYLVYITVYLVKFH